MKSLIHFFKIIFSLQKLPKFNYGNEPVRVKHSGSIIKLTGCHYSVELGTYMYWVVIDGLQVAVPESYLEKL